MESKQMQHKPSALSLPHHSSVAWRLWQATTHDVYLHLRIRIIWDLNLIDESFKTQFIMNAYWKSDPKTLKTIEDDLDDGEVFDGEDGVTDGWARLDKPPHWVPTLRIMKETEHLIDSSQFTNFHARKLQDDDFLLDLCPGAQVGDIWIRGFFKYTVQIAECWNLRMFPFDCQDLNLVILMTAGTRLHPSSSVECNLFDCELPDFKLGRDAWSPKWRLCRRIDLNYPTGIDGLHVRIYYFRQYWYYVWNAFLIVSLVSALATTSWAINRTIVEDRLSLDITLLLVVVAFQQVISAMVPAIAYLTLLDIYVISNIGLVVLATGIHSILGGLIDDCDHEGVCYWYTEGLDMETSLHWDRRTVILYVLLWVLFHVSFFTYIWLKWYDAKFVNSGFIDSSDKESSPEPYEWREVPGKKRLWNYPLPEDSVRNRRSRCRVDPGIGEHVQDELKAPKPPPEFSHPPEPCSERAIVHACESG